jgi:uncharacterized protein
MLARICSSILLLLLSPAIIIAQVTVPSVAGEWMGRLDAGPVELRIVLSVQRTDDGALRGTFNSVDQGAKMAVETISFLNRTLRFALPKIDGTYEGTMTADGGKIEGVWSQGGRQIPLTLERQSKPFALVRPQTPQPPFPYDSLSVEVHNSRDRVTLGCTLLVPHGRGPFPAALFLTGSGAQDRNETLLGHEPFRVIADHLGRHRIASLRCDDRGVGTSGGNVFMVTMDELAGDVQAALEFLADRPEIDDSEIGLIGHSEGALLAPLVASRQNSVDFMVLLAPPGVPMEQVLLNQARKSMRLRGISEPLISRILQVQSEELKLVKDRSVTRDELVARLRAREKKLHARLTADELRRLEVTPETTEQAVQRVATPWFRSLIRQNPADHLSRLDLPVLALLGEKDVQISPKENAAAVEGALRAAPTSDYTVKVLPGLNHLFQHAATGALSEYGTIEETIAPEVLELVTEWIRSNSDPPRHVDRL